MRSCLKRIRARSTATVSVIVACGVLALTGVGDEIQNPAIRPLRGSGGSFEYKYGAWLKTAEQGGVDFLLLGDSITDFWNGKVLKEYFGDLHVANFGLSGDRCENVLWHIQNGTLGGKMAPKLVMLLLGTNNLKSGSTRLPPIYTAEGVKAVLDEVLARLPHANVLLIGIFPRQPDYPWMAETVRETNVRLRQLAAHERVWYMDIGEQFLGPDGLVTKDLMPDLLHPNEAGYRIWAESIADSVRELLGEASATVIGNAGGDYATAYPPIQWCREHNQAWSRDLDAAAVSAPALQSDRLFVALGGARASIVCMATGSGDTLWECAATKASNPEHAVDPGVIGDHAVAAWSDGTVLCASVDGTRLWESTTAAHGVTAPTQILVSKSNVVVCGAGIASLDLETGSCLHKAELPGSPVLSRPAWFRAAKGPVVFTAEGICFNPAEGTVTNLNLPELKHRRIMVHERALFVSGLANDGGGRVCRYDIDPETVTLTESWSSDWGSPASRLSAPVLHEGRIYVLSCEGTLNAIDAANGAGIAAQQIEGAAADDEGASSDCTVWTTAEHVYARLGGARVVRSVFTLAPELKNVFTYSTDGPSATDGIGEFVHIVGRGGSLYAFTGATHAAPEPPLTVMEIAPAASAPAGELPVVPLEPGMSVTQWLYSATQEGATPTPFAALPEGGVWNHERFTAGLPALDLTAIYDRSVQAEITLKTVIEVKTPGTYLWELFTPNGSVWNRPDLVSGNLTIQDKEVPAGTAVALLPGFYALTLDVTRAPLGGGGKIWIGPRFETGPTAAEVASDKARFELEERHWQEHSQRIKEPFRVGAEPRSE